MILADTSIWIQFFRSGKYKREIEVLTNHRALFGHPFVVGELALGNLARRQATLNDLDSIPQLAVIPCRDVRLMIDSRQLYARGIGFTDANLLASCLATAGASLWTLDKRLNSVAEELNIAANISLFIK